MKEIKIISALIVGIFIISMFSSVVSAEAEIVESEGGFNLFTWIRNLFGAQTFSIVGDKRQCERYPSKTFEYEPGEEFGNVDAKYYCESGLGLINVYNYRNSVWEPYGEFKNELPNLQCGSENPCRAEVYCCPYPECNSDSDCESSLGEGSECLTEDADDENIRYFSGDNFSYCTPPGGEQITCWYYFEGDESCSSRTYLGDTECPATYMDRNLYESKSTCESQIDGGDDSDDDSGDDTGDDNGDDSGDDELPEEEDPEINVEIRNINSSRVVKSSEPITVTFEVENYGDEREYLVETGVIPKSVAEDWGFSGFSIFDWNSQQDTECCEGQENIFAKTTKLSTNEIDKFSIDIPRVPYRGIEDKCGDTDYFDGAGEYVIYVAVKNGCYEDGYREIVSATETIEIVGVGETKTWTEFFSESDEEFFEDIAFCVIDDNCIEKEGYEVSCHRENVIIERVVNMFYTSCNEDFGWLNNIVDIVGTVFTLGTAEADFCELSKDRIEVELKEDNGGICIAESNTWYGELWESTLKSIGGMGIPYQYTVIAAGALILIVLVLLMRMFI